MSHSVGERPPGWVCSMSKRETRSARDRRVTHRVQDRVVGEERVAREVHLRHEALGEGAPEDREVDVRGTPGVLVVPHGYEPGLIVMNR